MKVHVRAPMLGGGVQADAGRRLGSLAAAGCCGGPVVAGVA